MEYSELASLSRHLESVMSYAVRSLMLYAANPGPGFWHFVGKDGGDGSEMSKASTATAVGFLTRCGFWHDKGPDAKGTPWRDTAQPLLDGILSSTWNSSDLGQDNAFTSAFLIEAVLDLTQHAGAQLAPDQQEAFDQRVLGLCDTVIEAGGGVPLQDFQTSFMAQKVIRVIERWFACSSERLGENLDAREKARKAEEGMRSWSWQRLAEESLALSSGAADADVFELGYALLCACATTPDDAIGLRRRGFLSYALRQFFDAQQASGTWPRSQPLFMYPKHGNAYCFDFEFLVQLLAEPKLRDDLLAYLPQLALAARSLDRTQVSIGAQGQVAWASGHLIHEQAPESWTTASVFHFCADLHLLVAEAIRQSLFDYAGQPYRAAAAKVKAPSWVMPDSLLDSDVEAVDGTYSLKQVLNEKFLVPLSAGIPQLNANHGLHGSRSLILYGPPGTSKTTISECIGDAIGWPVLKIDPSHLTRHGMGELHAETHRLFASLERAEAMVVLFDEFDELVRDRDSGGADASSRFLTTAMLPKLTALYGRKRLVYIVATNHIELFDSAITRMGRFDIVVPVMPPTLAEKMKHWPDVQTKLEGLGLGTSDYAQLALLTFDEFKVFRKRLCNATTLTEARGMTREAVEGCTLNQKAGNSPSWKDQVASQRSRIRIPA